MAKQPTVDVDVNDEASASLKRASAAVSTFADEANSIKPRFVLETSSGGVTVIGETAQPPKPNNEEPTDAN